jgi:RHS repeat-associated protein
VPDTLDASGLRTGIAETGQIDRQVAYTYDGVKRLTSESVTQLGNDRRTSWTYDRTGNRLTQTKSVGPASSPTGTATTSYVYDANDRLETETVTLSGSVPGQTAGTTTYTYDAAGNTTKKVGPTETIDYVYDDANRMAELQTLAGDVTRYTYAHDGIRLSQTTNATGANPTTAHYLIDPNQAYAQVIEEVERQGTGALTVKALYAVGDDRVRRFTPAVAGGGGNPGVPAGLRYYHADGLGSTRLLTNETGSVTDRTTFEAFGEIDAAASSQASGNAFLYTGEQRDPNTGFYYLRARYMDPAGGRFTQQDSFLGVASDPASLHKYQYASGNAANDVDPSGNFSLGETQVASGVRDTLANMQAEGGNVAIDVLLNGGRFDPVRYLATASIMFGAAKYLPGWIGRSRPCAANSFVGETLVNTQRGLVPIDEIEVGEKVWAWDEAVDTEGWFTVLAAIHGKRSYTLIELKFESGETITATANHPFYIEREDFYRAEKTSIKNGEDYSSSHWVSAELIAIGERVRQKGGGFVKLIGARRYVAMDRVYNLSISGANTFFVGRSGLQTHNACSFVSMKQGSVLSFRSGSGIARKEVDMATDLAYHTGYDILLPAEQIGVKVKNVDGIIETTKKGLELKKLDRGTASAVKGAFEDGIKRGASPAAKVIYIDGMSVGLTRSEFTRGVLLRKQYSPNDPFHFLEEVYVRYSDGVIERKLVDEL